MDLYSVSKRSEIMSKIGSKNTKLEIMVRKILFANGFRYRVNDKRYPGKPDIFLPKYKTAIFIHGCFWHGHQCAAGRLPSTRVEFWKNKINSNIDRDYCNLELLKKMGFQVIIVWQCDLKNKQAQNITLTNLINKLRN